MRPEQAAEKSGVMEMTRFHERPTITPLLVADLLAEGERMPVYVHVIDHPDARVLVDTGMTRAAPGGRRHRSPPHVH